MIKGLKVFDATGHLIISQSVNALSSEVDARVLSKCVYLIHVKNEDAIETLSWLKQN